MSEDRGINLELPMLVKIYLVFFKNSVTTGPLFFVLKSVCTSSLRIFNFVNIYPPSSNAEV